MVNSYTLTEGASSGLVGTPSANFTVALGSGVVIESVVVWPSSTLGGVFNPGQPDSHGSLFIRQPHSLSPKAPLGPTLSR